VNELLTKLLDLDSLGLRGLDGIEFSFERPLAPWAWALVIAAALGLAWWSYRRLTGSRVMRAILCALRAALLVALVVLIAGPQLVERTERTERDWVLMLIDRSESLSIGDAPGATLDRRTRDAQARAAIREHWNSLRELSDAREVVWLGFDAGVFDLRVERELPLAPSAPADAQDQQTPAQRPRLASIDLGPPTGQRTAIGAALEQALRRAAARPLSGVVILSDGRSADEPSRAALRQLQADRIPVFALPLGDPSAAGDLAIRSVQGPGVAFTGDLAPVTVQLERVGGDADAPASPATVRLIDTKTGLTLAERRVELGDEPQTITLTTRADDPGDQDWSVEIVADDPDLIEANNTQALTVRLIDEPMRVLFIDGGPRWEQRYLKNLLIRERSIVSSNLILSPQFRYLQEGDEEISQLPESPEEWAKFDAVILGDVSPAVFTPNQLETLRDHIAQRGGGLLWIAGPSFVPSDWFGTALADLIPIVSAAGQIAPFTSEIVVNPAPLAERLGVMRLGRSAEEPWPEELSDPRTGWSALRWAQRIDPGLLKPAAEPLAFARPLDGSGEQYPLVITMRFGAGRSIYAATDEIWRWRYGRGEALPERFWLQLVRMLGRESLSRSGQLAVLEASPQRAVIDQPVRLALTLLDQSLIDTGFGSVAVRIERTPRPGEEPPSPLELTLAPESSGGAGLSTARSFATTWLPSEAGEWTVRPIEPGLASLGLSVSIDVTLPDDEMRTPQTDHALLERLSSETGGRMLESADFGRLAELLPNRRERLISERAESLWDSPLALIVIVTLLTLEWLGRRLIRLI
jgi:hypothetical protein